MNISICLSISDHTYYRIKNCIFKVETNMFRLFFKKDTVLGAEEFEAGLSRT